MRFKDKTEGKVIKEMESGGKEDKYSLLVTGGLREVASSPECVISARLFIRKPAGR